MAHITEQEVVHLANLARLKLEPGEVTQLTRELEAVLAYAESLQDVAKNCSLPQEIADCSMNVMRDDVIVRYDAELIMAQAPEREEDYFVVPRIIKRDSEKES